jgi:hypothetical protein
LAKRSALWLSSCIATLGGARLVMTKRVFIASLGDCGNPREQSISWFATRLFVELAITSRSLMDAG